MAREPEPTYPAGMEDERKEPSGPGHDKPKPTDAPTSTISPDVGKKNRVVPDERSSR